jgi:HAE1 family hydrophobic/amphiphilic exporter-1
VVLLFLRNQIKRLGERTEDGQSVDAVVKQLFAKTAGMKDAKILFFTPPSIRGVQLMDLN